MAKNLNGIYVNDIPANIFMKYFNETNVDNIEFDPIMIDLQIKGFTYNYSNKNIDLPYPEITPDMFYMFINNGTNTSTIIEVDQLESTSKTGMTDAKQVYYMPYPVIESKEVYEEITNISEYTEVESYNVLRFYFKNWKLTRKYKTLYRTVFTKNNVFKLVDGEYRSVAKGDLYSPSTKYYIRKKVSLTFDKKFNKASTYYSGMTILTTFYDSNKNKITIAPESYPNYIYGTYYKDEKKTVANVVQFLTDKPNNFDNYEETFISSFSDFNVYKYDNLYYIEFKKEQKQKTNDSGEALYLDNFGLETTESFVESRFKVHNNAIRKGFHGLLDKGLDIVTKLPVNTLGLVQKGTEYVPAYWEKYRHKITYTTLSGTPINGYYTKDFKVYNENDEIVETVREIKKPTDQYINHYIYPDNFLDVETYDGFSNITGNISSTTPIYLDIDERTIEKIKESNKGFKVKVYNRYAVLDYKEFFLNSDNEIHGRTILSDNTSSISNYSKKTISNTSISEYTVMSTDSAPYLLIPLKLSWNTSSSNTVSKRLTLYLSYNGNIVSDNKLQVYELSGNVYNTPSETYFNFNNTKHYIYTPEELDIKGAPEDTMYLKLQFSEIKKIPMNKEIICRRNDNYLNFEKGYFLNKNVGLFKSKGFCFLNNSFKLFNKSYLEKNGMISTSTSTNKFFISASESDKRKTYILPFYLEKIPYSGVLDYLSEPYDEETQYDNYVRYTPIQDPEDFSKFYLKIETYENILPNKDADGKYYIKSLINPGWSSSVFSLDSFIDRFRKNRRVVVDEAIQLRGSALEEKIYFNKKKNAISTLLTDLLKDDTKDFIDAKYMYLDSDPYNKMRIYAEGYKTLVELDQNIFVNKINKNLLLNDIDDVYFKILLEKKKTEHEDINFYDKDVELDVSEYRKLNKSAFLRLLNYEKYPTELRYEEAMIPSIKSKSASKNYNNVETYTNDIPYYYDKSGKFKYGYDNTIDIKKFNLSDISENIISSVSSLFDSGSISMHNKNFVDFYKNKLKNYSPSSNLSTDCNSTEKKVYSSSILDDSLLNDLIISLSEEKDDDDKEWRVII